VAGEGHTGAGEGETASGNSLNAIDGERLDEGLRSEIKGVNQGVE
jgi:hypothetical protein